MRIFLAIAAIIALLFGVVFATYVSTYNKAVSFEEIIIAQHKQTQNILGQHAPKIKEGTVDSR